MRLSVWRCPGLGDGGSDGQVVPATVEAVPTTVTAASGQAGGHRHCAGGQRQVVWRDGGWAGACTTGYGSLIYDG
jgi:hypothetical protein